MGKSKGKNEDYAIYVPGVGACVADGVGGAPLGDALARLSCCVAMRELRCGKSAVEAICQARDHVAEFVRTVDSPTSGASLTAIKFGDTSMEAAWLGDVALFVNMRSVDGNKTRSTLEECPTSYYMGRTTDEEPQRMEVPMDVLSGVVACTDGVWRRLGTQDIVSMMESTLTVREKAARLAMSEGLQDDSTALVLSVGRQETR